MDNLQVQRILDADYQVTREIYPLERFRPTLYHYFPAEELADLAVAHVPVSLQVCRRPQFRRYNGKTSYDDLEVALEGRLKSFALCGWELTRSGLVLEFLPLNSSKLTHDANRSIRIIHDNAHTPNAEKIRTNEEDSLYDRHARKIVVNGDFQLIFTEIGTDNLIITGRSPKSYFAAIIENARRTESINLRHDKSRPNYKLIYS